MYVCYIFSFIAALDNPRDATTLSKMCTNQSALLCNGRVMEMEANDADNSLVQNLKDAVGIEGLRLLNKVVSVYLDLKFPVDKESEATQRIKTVGDIFNL